MTKTADADPALFMAVDPFRCRLWHLHDRIEKYLTPESCRDEIESIRRDGQMVPAIGRCLTGDPEFEVEIICGARRLFVARHLKLPLRVQITCMTDQQAAAAMDNENRLRREISPYERGMCLAKLLRQGVFKTQEAMAQGLHLSPVQVSRLLKFSELPPLLIDAFANPREILESWAVELHKAWHDERNRLLVRRARALIAGNSRPPPAAVYEILLAPPGSGGRVTRRGHNPTILGPQGQKLLRIAHWHKGLTLIIPNEIVTPALESDVTRALSAIVLRHAQLRRSAAR